MKFTKITDVKIPTGNRTEDAGLDFYIPNDWNNGKPMKLFIGQQVNIPSGIKVKVPQGMMLQFNNKSGVAIKKGLVVGACVIDTGYRGEVHLNLFKVVAGKEDKKTLFGKRYIVLTPGEKIVQGVLVKVSTENINEISVKQYDKGPKTQRSDKGFGSTGTK